MQNTIETHRELAQAGTAGETRGLHARCGVPKPVLVSSDAGARKGQRAPGEILLLLQILVKPQGPSPHTLPLPQTGRVTAMLQLRRKESEFGRPWKRKGELGNQRRHTRGLWGYPTPVGTLTFNTLLFWDMKKVRKELHRNRVRPWHSQVSKLHSKGSPPLSSLYQMLCERHIQRQHTH